MRNKYNSWISASARQLDSISSTKQNEVLTENIQVILADDRHQLVLNDLFGFHVVFFLIHFSCAVDLTTAFPFKKSRFSLPIPGRIFQQLNTTEIHFLCLFFHFCCTSLETIAKLTLESNGVNFNVDIYHFIYLRNFQKKSPLCTQLLRTLTNKDLNFQSEDACNNDSFLYSTILLAIPNFALNITYFHC